MTLLLHTPLTPTLPVGLADAYASLRLEVGSAYTLVFFVMIIPLLVAMQWARATGPAGAGKSGGQGTMSGIPIRLVACGKAFADGTRALSPLDLDIAAGETIVLLGPSGCGKTTTLRIIAGLEAPDAGGKVLFDGTDVTAMPIENRNVGMVFQSYALFPNLSVAGNVGYGLRVRGFAPAHRRTRVQRDARDDAAGSPRRTAASTSSRAGNASASRSRARSHRSRACCCSTSR